VIARLRVRPAVIDALVVLVLVAIRADAWIREGMHSWSDNDGAGYVAFADQLTRAETWTTVPDLHETFMPTSLFRMIGYPLLIMVMKTVFDDGWLVAIGLFQTAVSLVANGTLYVAARRVSGSRIFAVVGALVYAFSYSWIYERYALTDSLYASVLTLLFSAWALGATPNPRAATIAGLALAAIFSLREFTLYSLPGMVPLAVLWAWQAPRRLAVHAALFAPTIALTAGVIAWNYSRTGVPLMTSAAQTTPLIALSAAARSGAPVFDEDTPLDRTAVRALKTGEFTEVREVNEILYREYGMEAPQIARVVQDKYARTWGEHPRAMWGHVQQNLGTARSALESRFLRNSLRKRAQRAGFSAVMRVPFDVTMIGAPLWFALALARRRIDRRHVGCLALGALHDASRRAPDIDGRDPGLGAGSVRVLVGTTR